MSSRSFTPPLRLVLNTDCNGHCFYCHHEGCRQSENMPKDVAIECARIAQRMSIPCLSLTGGEPTLRADIAEIINMVRSICVDTKVSLTSNGFNLLDLCDSIIIPIDSLNLSITSFDKNTASRFQNVDPIQALQAFHKFPSEKKNLNVIVVEDNYMMINEIIDYCITESISIDIMFELKEYSSRDFSIQRSFFKQLEVFDNFSIDLQYTPAITHWTKNNCRIRIKHPYFSKLLERSLCSNCKEKGGCFERICAVRVYPNAVVSPCLNQTIVSNERTLEDCVNDIYEKINSGFSIFEFLTT